MSTHPWYAYLIGGIAIGLVVVIDIVLNLKKERSINNGFHHVRIE